MENTELHELDPFHVGIYVREALAKIEMAMHARDSTVRASQDIATAEVWYHLESLAGAITSVANIFWPTRKGFPKKRARSLRDTLSLTSKIDPTVREVRNGYIHFDERIDQHLVMSKLTIYIDRNLMPRDYTGASDHELIGRNFDIAQWELSVFGSETLLGDAFDVLEEIRKACTAWLNARDPFYR